MLPTMKYLIKVEGKYIIDIDYEDSIYKYDTKNNTGEFNTVIKAVQTEINRSKIFSFIGFDRIGHMERMKNKLIDYGYSEVEIIQA